MCNTCHYEIESLAEPSIVLYKGMHLKGLIVCVYVQALCLLLGL